MNNYVLSNSINSNVLSVADVQGLVIEDVYYEKRQNDFLGFKVINQPQKLFVKTDNLQVY